MYLRLTAQGAVHLAKHLAERYNGVDSDRQALTQKKRRFDKRGISEEWISDTEAQMKMSGNDRSGILSCMRGSGLKIARRKRKQTVCRKKMNF